MTEHEQSIADDKMRAEIAKLIAESGQISIVMIAIPAAAAAGLMLVTASIVKIFFG